MRKQYELGVIKIREYFVALDEVVEDHYASYGERFLKSEARVFGKTWKKRLKERKLRSRLDKIIKTAWMSLQRV